MGNKNVSCARGSSAERPLSSNADRIHSRPRGRSYIHPSRRAHTSTAVGVTCLLNQDCAEGAKCAICCISTSEMHRYRRNAQLTNGEPLDEGHTLEHHFCVRCQSIMCDVCGELLCQVVRSMSPPERKRFGCVLGACNKEESRKHEYCPCCNPELQEKFEGPFRKFIEQASTQNVIYIEEADDGFVLVDLRVLPTRNESTGRDRGRSLRGQQMLAEEADVAPMVSLGERRARKQMLIDALVVMEDDESHTRAAAEKWFQLGEQMRSLERITIRGTRVTKCDCYANAVTIEPDTLLFSQALLAHMSKHHTVTIKDSDGVREYNRYGIASRVLRLDPTIVESWRNLGLVMSTHDTFSLDPSDEKAEKYTKNDALRMSVTLCPDDEESQYLAAFVMSPQTLLIPVPGLGDQTRAQIFERLLTTVLSDEEELDELIERRFGKRLSVFMCSEVCLLLPNHPLVQRYQQQYVFEELKDVLGVGAYGTVHRGSRVQTRGRNAKTTPIAVKLLRAELRDKTLASVPELHLLTSPYFSETMAAAYFVRYDEVRGLAMAYMQLAEIGSTFQYMKRQVNGRLHESEIRSIMLQTLTSLRLLHYHGVVHQDIKPANILVFDNFDIRLADFGVTAMTFCELMKVEVAGTEAYMAPEAYNDGKIAPANDIWSLAATLIELGSFTHPVPDPKHLRTPLAQHPYRPYIPDHFSPELKQLLASMLDYDYEKRPSAQDLLEQDYFVSLPSMESQAMYTDNKQHPGIPANVLSLEELSTMGMDTRMLSTLQHKTMAVTTMRQRKEAVVADDAPKIEPTAAPLNPAEAFVAAVAAVDEAKPLSESTDTAVAEPNVETVTGEAQSCDIAAAEPQPDDLGRPPVAPSNSNENNGHVLNDLGHDLEVPRKHSLSPVAVPSQEACLPVKDSPAKENGNHDLHCSGQCSPSTSDGEEEDVQYEVEEIEIE